MDYVTIKGEELPVFVREALLRMGKPPDLCRVGRVAELLADEHLAIVLAPAGPAFSLHAPPYRV